MIVFILMIILHHHHYHEKLLLQVGLDRVFKNSEYVEIDEHQEITANSLNLNWALIFVLKI